MYIDSYTVYPTVSVYLSFNKYMYTKQLEPYKHLQDSQVVIVRGLRGRVHKGRVRVSIFQPFINPYP